MTSRSWPARDIADARPLHLDHVGAHISEQLGTGRARLHMGEVENAHAIERPARLAPRLGARPRKRVARSRLRRWFPGFELHNFFGRLGRCFEFCFRELFARCHFQSLHHFLRTALCGLSLPMLPLSLPAAGSITALTSVGLPEFMASLTARSSSSGVVTRTPTPPNASISFS